MAPTSRVLARAITGALVFALALVAVGCIPDTGPAPTGDPFQSVVFDAINHDRAVAGRPPLQFSPKLAVLAGAHSCDMAAARALVHTDLQALIGTGDYAVYHTLRENIMAAPSSYTPARFEATWMASPPHRENILADDVTRVGMNVCTSSDGVKWATEEFGGL
jgi:uncharacterized protein YkwD